MHDTLVNDFCPFRDSLEEDLHYVFGGIAVLFTFKGPIFSFNQELQICELVGPMNWARSWFLIVISQSSVIWVK